MIQPYKSIYRISINELILNLTHQVVASVGSNPTRNQIFLITFDLVLDLGELDSSSIH